MDIIIYAEDSQITKLVSNMASFPKLFSCVPLFVDYLYFCFEATHNCGDYIPDISKLQTLAFVFEDEFL